ncbi:MAG TPA: QsdR family transcriptional regulator [Solimonas sp.]|nr:QsdR family transcriptional regulator [Solimonas sp.]
MSALKSKSGAGSEPAALEPAAGTRWAPTASDLLAQARKRFLAGERCDIESLAAGLGVSRATAYRWAGNADALMGEVVASLTEATFRRNAREVRGKGAARILEVMERGLRAIADSRAYQAFLARDPQRSLRIVASKEGPSQQRAITLHQELLEEEMAKGHLKLPVDAHTMAYALVRLAESFLYADLIAGEKPDLDKAMKILKMMLR